MIAEKRIEQGKMRGSIAYRRFTKRRHVFFIIFLKNKTHRRFQETPICLIFQKKKKRKANNNFFY